MNLKKVITAINNPILNDKLLNCKNIKVLKNDIQYKEGILEILELEKNIDILILSENLPGEISLIELLLKIKKNNIKIFIILETENDELKNTLFDYGIKNIYYNDKITIDELVKIIEKETIESNEELKNEIEKLKKIINEKEYSNERKIIKFYKGKITKNIIEISKKITKKHEKNSTKNDKKIIIFCGNYNSGKSIVLALFTKTLLKKSKKNLVINFNEKNNDIFFILNKRNNEYIDKNIIEKNENLSSKIDVIDGKIFVESGKFNKEKFEKINANYDRIYIENYFENDNEIEQEILKISNEIIFLSQPNLLEISKSKKILERYINRYLIEKEKINILFNKYNKYSIDENLLKKIFFEFDFIGKIKFNNKYNLLLNGQAFFNLKKIKKEYFKIYKKLEKGGINI